MGKQILKLNKEIFKLWETAERYPLSNKFFGFNNPELGYIGTNGRVVYRVPKENSYPFRDLGTLSKQTINYLEELFTTAGEEAKDTGELRTGTLGLERKIIFGTNNEKHMYVLEQNLKSAPHYEYLDVVQNNILRIYDGEEFAPTCIITGLRD